MFRLQNHKGEYEQNVESHKQELTSLADEHSVVVGDLTDKLKSVENSISVNKEGSQHKEVHIL